MQKANRVRSVLRNVLAISFWLHGLFVSYLLPASSHALAPFALRTIYNATLVTFILYYSWISQRGWFSVIYDLVWIYIWPLWVLFQLVKLASKGIYKFFKTHTIPSPVSRVTIATPQAPKPAVLTSTAQGQPNLKEAIQQWQEKHKPDVVTPIKRFFRPLLQFTFLWSILLLTLQNKFMSYIVCSIVVFGAFRAVYNLWSVLSGTSTWLDQLKSGFAQQLVEKMRQVREWEEASGTQDIAKEVNSLTLFESIFSYISRNRIFLSKCTTAIAAIVTVPFYIYISFLFSSVYIGMAHLQHISFAWSDAVLDSLYIPFAFTDLPHNFLIRFVAGLQGIAVTVMGWNIFFRNLNSKFERLAGTAEELRTRFDEEIYRQKLALVISRATNNPTNVPVPSAEVGTQHD